MQKLVQIIVPCYNESVSLEKFMAEVCKVLDSEKQKDGTLNFEFTFINDGSKDDTLQILKNIKRKYERADCVDSESRANNVYAPPHHRLNDFPNLQNLKIHIRSFSRNFGKEAAMFCGFQTALQNSAKFSESKRLQCSQSAQPEFSESTESKFSKSRLDSVNPTKDCHALRARNDEKPSNISQSKSAVILLDADLQDPPHLIPQMIEKWGAGAKVVYARRKDRVGESAVRAAFSETFYRLSNFVSDVKLQPGVRDFRLMDMEVVQNIVRMSEYHRFSKAMFEWVGYERECLEYDYIAHFKAGSSWSFFKLFKYAVEGIISFSTMPLRIAFVIGSLISALAFLYGAYGVVDKLLGGSAVSGWTSIIVLVSLIGGIQLMILGVMGEYIARIYEQVKNRPIYILDMDECQ